MNLLAKAVQVTMDDNAAVRNLITVKTDALVNYWQVLAGWALIVPTATDPGEVVDSSFYLPSCWHCEYLQSAGILMSERKTYNPSSEAD